MNKNPLIPMVGTGSPVPNTPIFCELIENGEKFIGLYDEDLESFIDSEDPDEYYHITKVVWYLNFKL